MDMFSSLFRMSDEVLDEFSRADLDPEDLASFEYHCPRNRNETRVDVSRKFAVCSECGCKRLEFKLTEHGQRLVYGEGWGNLTGKIHGCNQ